MNTTRTTQRSGLILLVVLGMLALFSMLAVTYVVFASQSRATSVALTRKDVRGNQSFKPLFEVAIKQLVRGTTDNSAATYGHSLLGDVYGDRESVIAGAPATVPAARQATLLTVRDFEFNAVNPANMPAMTYVSLQRPMLLGPSLSGAGVVNGHYLRVPLLPGPDYNNPIFLPVEHDVLNGRVVTFPEGNGPLSGHSFRILRYIGRIAPFASPTLDESTYFAQNYSITIDLMEADLSQIFAKFDRVTQVVQSQSLAEWANEFPAGSNAAHAGVYLCYDAVGAPNLLSAPYNLLLNSAPLNSHGVGVANNGASQIHNYSGTANPAIAGIDNVATGLLPNLRMVRDPNTGFPFNLTSLTGDTDEPYDAADHNNFFLAYRHSGATTPGQIIPSFHRAALINYFVNWKDPATYTEQDLYLTVRRIQAATARPLEIDVITPVPAFNIRENLSFTGSNNGAAAGGFTFSPTLKIEITNNWSASWTSTGLPAFRNWVNWLTAGPWDVDNDADGLTDSLWVDVGLPLQTSPDGKLLKAMVAYYVEDLDSKLDVNATASMAQTGTMPGISNNVPYTRLPDNEFARFNSGISTVTQGLGYGSAETSFRHLFARTFGNTPGADTAFQQFLMARYGRSSLTLDRSPGLGPFNPNLVNSIGTADDAVSQLRMREQENVFNHTTLPGLPMGSHGRATVALDRLGNPRVMNVDVWQQSIDEPYEARWLSAPFQDSPFNFGEWERIYRIGDGDRTGLPQRLQNLFGETETSLPTSNLRHEITPRSSHLRVPVLATRASVPEQPTSFLELVNTILRSRNLQPIQLNDRQNHRGFASLFPLEFQRGLPLDLNRPLGNGLDDDSDGEIDEPVELNLPQDSIFATSQRTIGFTSPRVREEFIPQSPLTAVFDPHVDGATPNVYRENLQSRQLLARHLYCLAQLIIPQNYRFPNSNPNLNYSLPLPQDAKLDRARILAQWAVNIVDFRDADSSMTRFPYDPFPLDVKNDASGNYYAWVPTPQTVVWGMEQPELLITESLATHDIRIKRDPMSPAPGRYDQYRIPQGSLFLEFFCPRTTVVNNPGNPSSLPAGASPALYNRTPQLALDLTRLAPVNPTIGGQAPVWRVYISGPTPLPPTSNPPPLFSPLEVYNDSARKNSMSYQLTHSNLLYDGNGQEQNFQAAIDSGFVYDRGNPPSAPLQLDPSQPHPADARILVFRPKATSANGLPAAQSFDPDFNNSPGVVDPESQVFVSETLGAVLTGGQYLVVGPRTTTNFGSRIDAFSDPTDPKNRPNTHRIELTPFWADMYRIDDNNPPNPPIKPPVMKRPTMNDCVTMVASSLTPPTWQSSRLPEGIGLNVSEPLANDSDYYPEPTAVLNQNDSGNDPETGAIGFGEPTYDYDAYTDYSAGPATILPPFDFTKDPSDPMSRETPGPLRHWRAGNNPTVNNGVPNTGPVIAVGTQQNWCTAYLQRLADPEKPWDATFNPYITVDWMPIDLTVFSGEEDNSDVYPSTPSQGQEIRFASRQKTGQPLQRRIVPAAPPLPSRVEFVYLSPVSSPLLGTTFYSAATHVPRARPAEGLSINFFDYELPMDDNNHPVYPPVLRPTDESNTVTTLGFLNSTFKIAGEQGTIASSTIRGLPADPNGTNTNWVPDALYWANRQYTTPLELVNVPLSSPGQFMQEFSALDLTPPISRYEPVDSSNNAAIPFSHLLPFTYEQSPRAALPNLPELPMSALFSLVETASPWAEANDFLDPRELGIRSRSAFGNHGENAVASNVVLQPLRAPYNRISKYVEPGRVNLNTVAEPNVLQGLFFNALQPNERTSLGSALISDLWRGFFVSRQGYDGATLFYNSPAESSIPGFPRFNPQVPTEFARVFKPAMEAGMVPLTRSAQLGTPTLDPDGFNAPVNSTLMRSDPAQNTLPLIREPYAFAQKNAFTDAHPITRLSNLTTERSNVFAVYVTIGLFEVDALNQPSQEYGADKGQAQRYKAFYVVDRSVPVGFQTGVDHNVEKTILLRRFLKTDDR